VIATLATLDGLEAMAGLAEPLTRAGYRLQLRSPGPMLSLIPRPTWGSRSPKFERACFRLLCFRNKEKTA